MGDLDLYYKVMEDQKNNGPHAKVGYCSEERHSELLAECIRVAQAGTFNQLRSKRILDIGAGAGALFDYLWSEYRLPPQRYFGVEPVVGLWGLFGRREKVAGWEQALFYPALVAEFNPEVGFMIGTCGTIKDPFPLIKSAFESCSEGLVVTLLDESKYKAHGTFVPRDIPAMLAKFRELTGKVIVSTFDRSEAVFYLGRS